jgi:hypothetical protein
MVENFPNIKKLQDADTEMYDVSGGGIISRILQYFNMSMSRWHQALAMVCIAWVPLVVLTIIDGTFIGGTDMPFIKDYSRQGRLLLGVPMLILIHNLVYNKLPMVLQYVAEVLMWPQEREAFIKGPLQKARRSGNAMWIQALLLLLVVVVAVSPLGGARFFDAQTEINSWIMTSQDGKITSSTAGKWMQFVSIPVFQFLFVRWLWRYFIWVVLMYRISRIPLKLRPTNPDGAGGLGILMLAQRNFHFFFWVSGVVLASNMIMGYSIGSVAFEALKVEIFGFLLMSLILIYFPLFFFMRQLIMTKYLGLLSMGRGGENITESFEEEWVREVSGKGIRTEEPMNPSIQMDYTSIYRNLMSFSIVPIRFGDIILISFVLFTPFVPVFFMHYSVGELLEKIIGVLI